VRLPVTADAALRRAWVRAKVSYPWNPVQGSLRAKAARMAGAEGVVGVVA